ncbi:MAG: VTC domain-containing protein [Planctomycetota bacterium]|jgi:hypothetical protein
MPRGQRETKFPFDRRSVGHVLGLLSARLRADPVHPTNRIHSIYFDTPGWASLEEKRNSDLFKTKVRVRWYADDRTDEPRGNCFFEVKRREGGRRTKERIRTDLSATRLAASPLGSSLVRELPRRVLKSLAAGSSLETGSLMPAMEISYRRWRFEEPVSGASIALDTDIHVARVDDTRLPRPRPECLDEAVLEVKGEWTELPPALADLTPLGVTKRSFSKYGLCCEQQFGRAI